MSIICYNNTSGFTYDGVAPYPFIHRTGDTWRERDSSNNIVQDWYWNGTYWVTIEKSTLYLYSEYFGQAFPINKNYSQIYILNFSVTATSSFGGNNNSSNYRQHKLLIYKDVDDTGGIGNIIATINSTDLLNGQKKSYVIPINNFYSTSTFDSILPSFNNFGSPNEAYQGSSVIEVRYAR